MSFTEDGITVYADGVAIPDYAWYRDEGNLDSPAQASEAYLLQNQEPWILGADTSGTKHNDTPAEFATDDEPSRRSRSTARLRTSVCGAASRRPMRSTARRSSTCSATAPAAR